MSDWKDIFTFTRHQREGALAVIALIGITLFVLWVPRLFTPDPSPSDTAAIERFNASIDSLEALAARRDSVKKAKHKPRSGGHHDSHKAKGRKKPSSSPKRPAKKPAPQRPLPSLPTF